MRIKYFIFVLISICFISCANYWEAMWVSKDFPKEYTGLDTLIRIDGYYYLEDNTGIVSPFRLSNNGSFLMASGLYKDKNHTQIQEQFRTRYIHKGSYILSGDTIKIRWAMVYDLTCYEIFSEQYLIINDTTLRNIWYLCETCQPSNNKKQNPIRNDIYKFYQYDFED